jgi:hypothetical protein
MCRLRAQLRRLLPAASLLVLPALGCGDSSEVGKTYPVAGKITLDGEPLTAASTVVLFKPDAARGNSSPFEPTGTVDGEGKYTLVTKGKKGAPPGWYKVTVTATGGLFEATKGPTKRHPGPRSLLPARYGQAATTPFSIEVVEYPAPDSYDLRLTAGAPPGG